MKVRYRIVGVLLGITLVAACGGDSEPAADGEKLTKIVHVLGTRPSASSAPWLLGIKNGYFKEEGIDLEVQPADSPSAGMATVLSGDAQFASIDFTTLGLAKTDDPENDVKIICLTYVRPPYTIYSLKDGADVQTPEDLAGKTVYGPTGSSMMKILSVWLDHLGIEGVKFKEVDSASREPLLLSGEIDVIVGFATSMPPLQKAAADQGDELVALQPANEGLDTYYSSGLAAKQSYVDEHQDLAQGFVDAAVRSYAYAFDHIDEAAQIATETYPELDQDLNVKELEILRDLVTDEGRADTIGAIDPEKVQITIDYAKDVLGIEVPPEDLYLTDFAPK